MYWFPYDTIGIGRLKVYFNCYKIYDIENFNVNDSIYKYTDSLMNNWSDEEVYYGLTAATATQDNNHRVKFFNELKLSKEKLCENYQLEADFPNFCGSVAYRWTPEDGLLNPYSSNPVAYKTGYYKCEIIFTDTTKEAVQDYLLMNPGPIIDSIYVEVENSDYSFRKRYGNVLNFDSASYETKDGLCGANMAIDCGYLITGWNESFIDPNNIILLNDYPSYSPLLIKTDYEGRVQWSKIPLYTGDYDFNNLTGNEKEFLRFRTMFHYVIPDFIAKEKMLDGDDGKSDDRSEKLIRTGFMLAGEIKEPKLIDTSESHAANWHGIPNKTILSKIDLDGNFIENKILQNEDATSISLNCREITNLDDYSYLMQIYHDNRFGLLHIDYTEKDGFELKKHFMFNIENIDYIFYGNSFLSIPLNQNSKIRDRIYKHIYLTDYTVTDTNNPTTRPKIGLMILNDIKNSHKYNIIENYITIPNYNSTNLSYYSYRLLYEREFGDKFYIVTPKQLVLMNINGSVIKNYKLLHDFTFVIGGTFFRDDKIYVLTMQSFYLVIDLIEEKVVKYNFQEYIGITDNIIKDDNGFSFASTSINDIFLNRINNNYLNCTDTSIIEMELFPITPQIEVDNVLVRDNYDFELIDIEFDELENTIIDKDYGCVSLPVDYCSNCENIDSNSFELELVRVEDEGEDCCYELYMKNNSFCDFWGFDFELKYLIDDSTQTYQTENYPQMTTLYKNGRYKLKKICKSSEELPNEFEVRLKHSGSYCQQFDEDEEIMENLVWKIDFECDSMNCCETFEIISIVYEQQLTSFCYNILTYSLSTDCGDNFYIEVWDENNLVIHNSNKTVATGDSLSITLSFNSGVYENDEEVKIVLKNSLGEILCIKEGFNLDLMKCNCCDFEILPTMVDQYTHVITEHSLFNFGLECDVDSIIVRYNCNGVYIYADNYMPGDPYNKFDGTWFVRTPCTVDSLPCLNPTIEVIVIYEDSTTCMQSVSVPCNESDSIITGKQIFVPIEVELVNLKLYPNPTTSNSTLEFALEKESNLNIELYNLLGSKEIDIYSGNLKQGSHSFEIKTENLSKGTYIVNIRIDDKTYQKKLKLE